MSDEKIIKVKREEHKLYSIYMMYTSNLYSKGGLDTFEASITCKGAGPRGLSLFLPFDLERAFEDSSSKLSTIVHIYIYIWIKNRMREANRK
jgi:hypothetical protein